MSNSSKSGQTSLDHRLSLTTSVLAKVTDYQTAVLEVVTYILIRTTEMSYI